MWPLLAVRTAWLAVFFVGIGVFVLWFLLRVVGDLITWFREEILDDYRQLRKTAEAARRARRVDEEEQVADADTENPS